jgi:hypothetical protein
MSKVTTLAEGQLTAVGTITIELVEADQTPAVVMVQWPPQPTVLHLRRFPDTAPWSLDCSLRQPHCWPQSRPAGGCEPLRSCRHSSVAGTSTPNLHPVPGRG